MKIEEKIERMALQYEDSRKTVAEFLLKEQDRLNGMSMQEVADATFTSKATLVRVAKALGFSGWSAFMKAYVYEVHEKRRLYGHVDANFPFERSDSLERVNDSILQTYMESIVQTHSMVKEEDLRRAVRMIEKAERIVVLGNGANQMLGQIFAHKMIKIEKLVTVCPESEMRYHIRLLGPDDLVIMVSYTGSVACRPPCSMIGLCRQKGIPILALTGNFDNILRREADLALTVFTKENVLQKIATYSSETSILFLFDVLYSGYFALHYDENMQKRIASAKEAEREKIDSIERLKKEY